MTEEQEQELTEKLTRLDVSSFEVLPGQEEVLMLFVRDHLICGVEYALSMPDDEMKALIDETVEVA